MPELIASYWQLVEPIFSDINIYEGPEVFARCIADMPRPVLNLYAAHFCLSEVHNGGFLQFFWNNTGVMAPESIDGFRAIGMPHVALLITDAAKPLGAPYPRDRDARWDALLAASDLGARELKRIFKQAKNYYSAFEEATAALGFDSLNEQLWATVRTENGGFQDAATRYAQGVRLVH